MLLVLNNSILSSVYSILVITVSWFLLVTPSYGQELVINKFEKYIHTLEFEDYYKVSSLSHNPDSCSVIFRILFEKGIITSAIKNLSQTEMHFEGYLFYNGEQNTNSSVLYDQYFNEVKYLVEAGSILVIRFDLSTSNIFQSSFALKREKTTFLNDISSIRDLFSKFKGGSNSEVGYSFGERKLILTFEHVLNIGPAPSVLYLNIKKISIADLEYDTDEIGDFDDIISISNNKLYYYRKIKIEITNAERKYFGLSIGASFTSNVSKSFEPSLSDENLFKVKNNIVDKWKTKAMLLFNFYPGVESEWTPSYRFWKSEFFNGFWNRFSLGMGVQITERPFDKLFFGIGFGLARGIAINYGITLNYEPRENTEVKISRVQKLEDISGLFPHKYELGSFLGVSIIVSELSELL